MRLRIALFWLLGLLPASLSAAQEVDANASHVIYYTEGSYMPSNTTGQGGSLLIQHYLLPGKVLVAPAANLHDMPDGCDKSCRELAGCNTYAYCPGYNADKGACYVSHMNYTIPPFGCQLMWQNESAPETGRPLLGMKTGAALGGAPLRFVPQPIAGYDMLPGAAFYGTMSYLGHKEYEYSCPGSLAPGKKPCTFLGTAEDVSPRCTADPQCLGFVHFPAGREYSGFASNVFKGGPNVTYFNVSRAVLSQNAVTYIKTDTNKDAPPTGEEEGGDGGLSAAAIAGIAIGAFCGAVLLAGGIFLFIAWRRRSSRITGPAKDKGRDSGDSQAETGTFAHADLEEQLSISVGKSIKGGSGGSQQRSPGAIASSDLGSSSRQPFKLEGPLSSSEKSVGLDLHLASPQSSATSDGLLSRLPRPDESWPPTIVEFESIKFCTNEDGSLQELGSGAFSKVYRVVLDGVQHYAAKVLDLGKDNERLQQVFIKEASLLATLRHRNIPNFAGVCVWQDKGIILQELMEGRDLHTRLQMLNKAGQRLFSWNVRGKMVAIDVARAIHYLHSQSVTHFDIKSSNVLLSRDLTAKLADVGFARRMRNAHHSLSGSRTPGTFDYLAPELLMGLHCTEKVDIYSFGVLLHEVCTGEYPDRGCLRPLQVPEDCPSEVVQLYLECIEQDPAKRPTARELVERLTQLLERDMQEQHRQRAQQSPSKHA